MGLMVNSTPSPDAIQLSVDANNDSPPNKLGQEFAASAGQGFLEPLMGMEDVDRAYAAATNSNFPLEEPFSLELPQESPIKPMIDQMEQYQAQVPNGIPKDIVGFIGQGAGMMANPVSWLGSGEAEEAGLFGAQVGAKLGVPFAETAGKSIATGAVAGATGMALPTLAANYDENTQSFDVKGIVKDTAMNAAFGAGLGLTFGSAGFAVNHILGKVQKAPIEGAAESGTGGLAAEMPSALGALGDGIDTPKLENFTQEDLDHSKETGAISPTEHALLTSVKNGASDRQINDLANQVATQNKLPVDNITDEIPLQLLTNDDIDQIAHLLPYEIASGAAEDGKPVLSNFIAETRLNEAVDNPGFMDAIENLYKTHSAKIDDLESKVNDLEPFKNKNLNDDSIKMAELTHNKLIGLEQSGEPHDFHVPNAVKKTVDMQAKLDKLNANPKTTPLRLEDAKQSLSDFKAQNIKSLRDEMIELKSKVNDDAIKMNSDNYFRLQDLQKNGIYGARALMSKFENLQELKSQRAKLNVLDAITKYSYMPMRTPLRNVLDYAKKMAAAKVVVKPNKMYDKIEQDIGSAVQRMDEGDMLKLADNIPKEDSEFADDIKEHVINYKKLKAAGDIMQKLIGCVRGE